MDEQRQAIDVDIACVGFGPATAGFLSTLTPHLMNKDGTPNLESAKMPGMPLQIMCYERADDIGFGVSGVVSKADSIRRTFPELKPEDIPMTSDIHKEKLVYLKDTHGASRRSGAHKVLDGFLNLFNWLPFFKNNAVEFPYIPGPMKKDGGLIFSMGQFTQWAGQQIMGTGMVQIWPGTPVSEALFEGDAVRGIRLMDQGTDKNGAPDAGYMPGMNVNADLTVIGDGPVGAVGTALNEKLGMPDGHEIKDWAVGMKMVVELPIYSKLEAGTVIHTIGYPEPEIFGFLYVHPDHTASMGIFVPSWFNSPVRSSYRYLQHWMMHPYLWPDLKGGKLKSWGAKSIQESGKHGEPFWVGDGFARIGEGSGSTNIFLNSGVDEAWGTGAMLAEAVIDLAKNKKSLTKDNLEAAYVQKRRQSKMDKQAQTATGSRDGFQKGFFRGMLGMGLTLISGGRLRYPATARASHEREDDMSAFYKGRISRDELITLRDGAYRKGQSAADAVLTRAGWPEIPYDGELLMTHQDALFAGGKVQAPAGFKDHVTFIYPDICKTCEHKLCIENCSGQAITPGENGVPVFDREKCVHCGACYWNCVKTVPEDTETTNVSFQAGAGGLHSVEN
ncbi:MAG: 4Fe-4S ferredoxin [candidate division KSB1 bacterium]|nr:4Fe-4S ferredoxin [candidate division KSB1 bacterium]